MSTAEEREPEQHEVTSVDVVPEVLDLRGSFSRAQRTDIAGILVDIPYVPQCLTCNAIHRAQIEEACIKGFGRPTVARMYVPDSDSLRWPVGDEDRDPESRLTDREVASRIGRHIHNGHSPVHHALRHAILEAAAQKSGLDLDETEGSIITAAAIRDTMKQRYYEGLVEGTVRVTGSDIVSILKQEQTSGLEEEVKSIDLDSYQLAMRACFDLMAEIMDESQQQEFAFLLGQRPEIMRVLRPEPQALGSGS